MKYYGHIDLNGNNLKNATLENLQEFPEDPFLGQMTFRRKRAYVCTDISGDLPIWVPMTQEITTYIHTQSVATDTWTINHGLNTALVNIDIFDATNKIIIPDEIDASVLNQVVVKFSGVQAGKAVISSGNTYGAPKPVVAFTDSFTNLSTWIVTHGLGYFPDVGVYIGGQLVQPMSITNDSTTQCTITFSAPQSGSVRCI